MVHIGMMKNGKTKNGMMKNGEMKTGMRKNGEMKNTEMKTGKISVISEILETILVTGETKNGEMKTRKRRSVIFLMKTQAHFWNVLKQISKHSKAHALTIKYGSRRYLLATLSRFTLAPFLTFLKLK
jgi:hypothetical protein